MTDKYKFTDNPTAVGTAICNPDILDECLMHLKYDNNKPIRNSINCALSKPVITYNENTLIITENTSTSTSGITKVNSEGSLEIQPTKEQNSAENIYFDETFNIVYNAQWQLEKANRLFEQLKEPMDWQDGDLWFCTAPDNFGGFKKINGVKTDYEFCKVGKVKLSNGTIANVEDYAFNVNNYNFNNASYLCGLAIPDYGKGILGPGLNTSRTVPYDALVTVEANTNKTYSGLLFYLRNPNGLYISLAHPAGTTEKVYFIGSNQGTSQMAIIPLLVTVPKGFTYHIECGSTPQTYRIKEYPLKGASNE